MKCYKQSKQMHLFSVSLSNWQIGFTIQPYCSNYNCLLYLVYFVCMWCVMVMRSGFYCKYFILPRICLLLFIIIFFWRVDWLFGKSYKTKQQKRWWAIPTKLLQSSQMVFRLFNFPNELASVHCMPPAWTHFL